MDLKRTIWNCELIFHQLFLDLNSSVFVLSFWSRIGVVRRWIISDGRQDMSKAKLREKLRASVAGVELLEGRRLFATIAGHVYNDFNANGVDDDGLSIQGQTVYLSPVNATTQTDENGNYQFDDLDDENTNISYTVSVLADSGWEVTDPYPSALGGSRDVSVPQSGSADFGLAPPVVSTWYHVDGSEDPDPALQDPTTPKAVEFTLYRTGGNFTRGITVPLQWGGTALPDDFRTALPEEVSFPTIEGSVTISLIPRDDETVEDLQETLALALQASAEDDYRFVEWSPTEDVAFLADNDFTIVRAQVSFGDLGVNPDLELTIAPTPAWLDLNGDGNANGAGEHHSPLSFTRSTSGIPNVVGLDFSFTIDKALSGQYTITGTGTGLAGGNIVFEANFDDTGIDVIAGSACSDRALVDTIDNGDLAIVWQIKRSFAGAEKTVIYGQSVNHAYVTSNATAGEYESVLWMAATKAKGLRPGEADEAEAAAKTHSVQVVDAIWDYFQTRQITNVAGHPLVYWGANAQGIAEYTNLLKFEAGQCGAFAKLFAQVLRTAGIGAVVVKVIPIFDWVPPPAPGVTADGTLGFYVNPGAHAQNNDRPWNFFADHAIVRLSDAFLPVADHTYFDPSYGKKYEKTTWEAAKLEWADDAITQIKIHYSDFTTAVLNNPRGGTVICTFDDTNF
jgi:hypothetical protein